MFNVEMNGRTTGFRTATRVYDYVSLIASRAEDYPDYSDPVVTRDGAPLPWADLTRLMKFEASRINGSK